MDAKTFEDIVLARQDAIQAILLKKSREYATDEDRLHNFHAAAGLNGVPVTESLWGMATKHIVSLADMVKNPTIHTRALWDEKLTDALAYLHLLDALVRDCGISEEKADSRTSVRVPENPFLNHVQE